MSTAPGTGNAPELVLCPSCCTIDDIGRFGSDPEALPPQVRCARCSFTFPLMPAALMPVTLEAMHRHDCRVANEPENWAGVAQAINERVHELGLSQKELAERSCVLMSGQEKDPVQVAEVPGVFGTAPR